MGGRDDYSEVAEAGAQHDSRFDYVKDEFYMTLKWKLKLKKKLDRRCKAHRLERPRSWQGILTTTQSLRAVAGEVCEQELGLRAPKVPKSLAYLVTGWFESLGPMSTR